MFVMLWLVSLVVVVCCSQLHWRQHAWQIRLTDTWHSVDPHNTNLTHILRNIPLNAWFNFYKPNTILNRLCSTNSDRGRAVLNVRFFLKTERATTTLDCIDSKVKSKAIPITGRGGLSGCEMLRIPHCLDSRLTVNCGILREREIEFRI
jgi:hypothetical protein